METTRRALLQRIAAASAAGLAPGCGYLLYPERIGQEPTAESRLDVGVLILDGILVLVGCCPG